MSEANAFMHGGDHYRRAETAYQHWDWSTDVLDNRYFESAITKYVSRQRSKGVAKLDLEKAQHYLLKLRECHREFRVPPIVISRRQTASPAVRTDMTERFIAGYALNSHEANVMRRAAEWGNDADLLLIAEDIRLLQAAL